MRIYFETDDLSFLGVATDPYTAFNVAWLTDDIVNVINANAPYKICKLEKPGRARGELPAHVEQEMLDYASVDEPVTPCTDLLGARERERAFAQELANGLTPIVSVPRGVRAFSLDPRVVAVMTGASVTDCQLAAQRGLYRADDAGCELDKARVEREAHDRAQAKRAAQDAARATEVVTFRPRDFGRACLVCEPGFPVPWVMTSCPTCFGAYGPGLIMQKKTIFFEAPPGIEWTEFSFQGARVLASDCTMTLPRAEVPTMATPRNWRTSVWSRLSRLRTDLDRSQMDGPFLDLREERAQRSSEVIRAYLKTNKPECAPVLNHGFDENMHHEELHYEVIARRYGSLSVDLLISLLKEAGWLRDGSTASVDFRLSAAEARVMLASFQQAGVMVSKGDYPESAQDEQAKFDAAIVSLLAVNEAPTHAEAQAHIMSLGLADPSGRLIVGGLKRAGLQRKRNRANGVDEHRWSR